MKKLIIVILIIISTSLKAGEGFYVVGATPFERPNVYGLNIDLKPNFLGSSSNILYSTYGISINLNPINPMLGGMLFFHYILGDHLAIEYDSTHIIEPESYHLNYGLLSTPLFIDLNDTPTKTYGISFGGIASANNLSNGIIISVLNFNYYSKGISIGFSNQEYKNYGMQVGVINGCQKTRGIQIGFYNRSSDLKGLQIGFVNKNSKRTLPFINWDFWDENCNKYYK